MNQSIIFRLIITFLISIALGNASTLPTVNDCVLNVATDRTGQAAVTISFGNAFGLTYSPACVHIDPGTQITFSGLFASHSLRGGSVVAGVEIEDFTSPIPSQDTGTTRTFPITRQGMFGYYCLAHGASDNMYGAVIVGNELLFVDGFGD